jgi:hypothetical protein
VGDEQFCSTCGAWVDPLDQGDRPEGEFEEFSLGETPDENGPAPVRVPRQEVQCPSCGARNPANNRHCEECGARLSQGALPVAPRPAVQTTAGVRAAMGISAVLVVVVLAVALINLFSGDDASTETTAATDGNTTTTEAAPAAPLTLLDPECTVEGYSGLGCGNLTDGDATQAGEYQFDWVATTDAGENPTIVLKFLDGSVTVRGIVWSNIEDETRFQQNYRASRITITADDGRSLPVDIQNSRGDQVIDYVAIATNTLTIEITGAHAAQDVEGQVFNDLAVAEIQVVGNPAGGGAAPADTSETTGAAGASETTEG